MKKQTKKIISVCLAVLLFAFAPLNGFGLIVTSVAEATAETAGIALETDWELNSKNCIAVKVYFTEAVELVSWDLSFYYDADIFDYLTVVGGVDSKAVNMYCDGNSIAGCDGYASYEEEDGIIRNGGYFKESLWTAEEFLAASNDEGNCIVNDKKFHYLTIYLTVEDEETFNLSNAKIEVTGNFTLASYNRFAVESATSKGSYCRHENRVETTVAATCTTPGIKTSVCSSCGETLTETITIDPANHIGETELRNAVSATETRLGYTGDVYCLSCNTIAQNGKQVAFDGSIDFGSCGENLTWILNGNGVLTIYGTGKMDTFRIFPWAGYCDTIKAVVIENGVTDIANGAFAHCTALQSVALPDSLTNIGDYAFRYCSSLTSVLIPPGLTNISTGAFQGCTAMRAINADEKNPNYISEDGVLYNKNKTVLVCYPAAKTDTTFTVPASVEIIDYYAFYNNANLSAVALPDGLKEIGKYAFSDCVSLHEIEIPDSVEAILEAAFQRCTALKNVYFDKNSNLVSFGGYTFANCTALTSITIPDQITNIGWKEFAECSALETIICSKNSQLEDFGYQTFYGCTALKSVVVPKSIDTASYGGFEDCVALCDVYYMGNETQWNIFKNNVIESSGDLAGNDYLFNANIHFNYCPHENKEILQAVPANCVATGLTSGEICADCGEKLTAQIKIAALGHTDQNGDNHCDICSTVINEAIETCDHMCHKSGFMGFIWKIVRLFWMVFDMNPVCECGEAHY